MWFESDSQVLLFSSCAVQLTRMKPPVVGSTENYVGVCSYGALIMIVSAVAWSEVAVAQYSRARHMASTARSGLGVVAVKRFDLGKGFNFLVDVG